MRIRDIKTIKVKNFGAQGRGVVAHLSQHPAKQVVVLHAPTPAVAPHDLIENDLKVHDDPFTTVDAEVFKWN